MTNSNFADKMVPYYEHDGITIYHGDCRKILSELDLDFDVLITDPPYGVDFRGKETKHSCSDVTYTVPDDPLIGPEVVSIALRRAKRGAVFSGIPGMSRYPIPNDVGCVFCPSGAGRGPWGFCCFNPILFYGKRPGGPTSPSSIISFDTSDNLGNHPCAKPMRWMTWLMGIASLPGELILDPFMGSGTTLRAAKDMGRRAIGIEICESYCKIAVGRLKQECLDLSTSRVTDTAEQLELLRA